MHRTTPESIRDDVRALRWTLLQLDSALAELASPSGQQDAEVLRQLNDEIDHLSSVVGQKSVAVQFATTRLLGAHHAKNHRAAAVAA